GEPARRAAARVCAVSGSTSRVGGTAGASRAHLEHLLPVRSVSGERDSDVLAGADGGELLAEIFRQRHQDIAGFALDQTVRLGIPTPDGVKPAEHACHRRTDLIPADVAIAVLELVEDFVDVVAGEALEVDTAAFVPEREDLRHHLRRSLRRVAVLA